MTKADAHLALQFATSAVEIAKRCLSLTPEEAAEVGRALAAGTGSAALLVRCDKDEVRIELALVAGSVKETPYVEHAVLRLDSPLAAVLATSESGELVDANRLH